MFLIFITQLLITIINYQLHRCTSSTPFSIQPLLLRQLYARSDQAKQDTMHLRQGVVIYILFFSTPRGFSLNGIFSGADNAERQSDAVYAFDFAAAVCALWFDLWSALYMCTQCVLFLSRVDCYFDLWIILILFFNYNIGISVRKRRK